MPYHYHALPPVADVTMLGVSWVAAWNKLVLGNSMESHQPLILIRISLHRIQLLIYDLWKRWNLWVCHFDMHIPMVRSKMPHFPGAFRLIFKQKLHIQLKTQMKIGLPSDMIYDQRHMLVSLRFLKSLFTCGTNKTHETCFFQINLMSTHPGDCTERGTKPI